MHTSTHRLPHGWREEYDQTTGRTYYANRITRTTQWEIPTEDAPCSATEETEEAELEAAIAASLQTCGPGVGSRDIDSDLERALELSRTDFRGGGHAAKPGRRFGAFTALGGGVDRKINSELQMAIELSRADIGQSRLHSSALLGQQVLDPEVRQANARGELELSRAEAEAGGRRGCSRGLRPPAPGQTAGAGIVHDVVQEIEKNKGIDIDGDGLIGGAVRPAIQVLL